MAQTLREMQMYRAAAEKKKKEEEEAAARSKRNSDLDEKNLGEQGRVNRQNALMDSERLKLEQQRFALEKKAFEDARDKEYNRGKAVFDVAAGNMSQEQFAGKYGATGMEGLAYRDNVNNRNDSNFWKLAGMQQGMDLQGKFPRQQAVSGVDQSLTGMDSDPAAGNELAQLLGVNKPQSNFDMNKTIDQVNQMNTSLYGMNKPKQTSFNVGRNGQNFNVDLSGAKPKWTNQASQNPSRQYGFKSPKTGGVDSSLIDPRLTAANSANNFFIDAEARANRNMSAAMPMQNMATPKPSAINTTDPNAPGFSVMGDIPSSAGIRKKAVPKTGRTGDIRDIYGDYSKDQKKKKSFGRMY